MPRPAGRLMPVLRAPGWPLRAEAWCRPLLPGEPAGGLLVAFEVDGGAVRVPVPVGGFDDETADLARTEALALANLAATPSAFDERRIAEGHALLMCHDPYAAEQVLSPAALREAARRLGSEILVVAVPRPGALYVSTPHPVALAALESLANAAFEVVARNGGPALSRDLFLAVDARVVSVFVPGSLAARRAVGVVSRPLVVVAGGTPAARAPGETAGFAAWIRRLTGG